MWRGCAPLQHAVAAPPPPLASIGSRRPLCSIVSGSLKSAAPSAIARPLCLFPLPRTATLTSAALPFATRLSSALASSFTPARDFATAARLKPSPAKRFGSQPSQQLRRRPPPKSQQPEPAKPAESFSVPARLGAAPTNAVYTTDFQALGCGKELVEGLKKELNVTSATEIQSLAIPQILAGRDVLLASQTGTGKTLAYLLPIIQRLRAEERPAAAPAADQAQQTDAAAAVSSAQMIVTRPQRPRAVCTLSACKWPSPQNRKC